MGIYRLVVGVVPNHKRRVLNRKSKLVLEKFVEKLKGYGFLE